jgi:hypothetical protein
MKRFEGPANGIRLNPKEVSRINISSISDTIPTFLFFNYNAKGKPEFISVRKTSEMFLQANARANSDIVTERLERTKRLERGRLVVCTRCTLLESQFTV